MKTTILTTIFLVISSLAYAQINPVDFEEGGNGADWSWTVFENADNPPVDVILNPDQSGENTSDSVAAITARAGGATFAGATTRDIGQFTLDQSNQTITMMVWKSKISDVGLKLETASGYALPEVKVANTVTNQWEELTFDFSGVGNPPDEPWDGLTIFPDFGERTEDAVVYFDNITFSEAQDNGGGTGTTVSYCSETVFNNGITAETASEAILTIENVDSQSMKVTMSSANSDPLDVLIVNNFTGPITGSPQQSAVDTLEDGSLTQTLTWTGTPPSEVELNVLWSKVSFAGNWQLGTENTTVDFTQTCEGSGGTGDNLLTNGDFELGDDGSWGGNALDIREEGGNYYYFADVATAGAASDVNLSQVVNITQGESYTLTFEASTSTGNTRTMVAGIGLNEAPWTAATETVTLTDQTQTFSIELTAATFGSANSRVLFDMGADAGVVVIDNVTLELGVSGGDESAPTEAAPTPPDRTGELISVFSDKFTDVADTDFNPNWNQSTVVTTEQIEGNATLKYANLNYQGTQFASPLDLSNVDNMHIDVWTGDATSINLSLISGPAGSTVETAYSLPVTQNEWVTYDIPLTEWSSVVDLSDVVQLKIDDAGAGDSPTLYIDNIYFYSGVATSIDGTEELPGNFKLEQNYPNPFNPSTNISYTLPANAEVTLEVFNVAGQRVATLVDAFQSTGTYNVTFDASNLASGLYTYRLTTGNSVQVKKMMLIK